MIEKDSLLTELHNTKGWKKILKKMEANKRAHEKELNHDLISQLDSLVILDQHLIAVFDSLETNYKPESNEYKKG